MKTNHAHNTPRTNKTYIYVFQLWRTGVSRKKNNEFTGRKKNMQIPGKNAETNPAEV